MRSTFVQRLKWSWAFGGWKGRWESLKDPLGVIAYGPLYVLLGAGSVLVGIVWLAWRLIRLVYMPFHWSTIQSQLCEELMEKYGKNQ